MSEKGKNWGTKRLNWKYTSGKPTPVREPPSECRLRLECLGYEAQIVAHQRYAESNSRTIGQPSDIKQKTGHQIQVSGVKVAKRHSSSATAGEAPIQ
ncbi:hypothetical protein HAX54_009048, partial [Datura stramonium]|nr:hypothetical protein [Datura stramonium]